jgi:hypothetical protein
MTDRPPTHQLHALARTRPIRIAFFVELDESSHPILDSIFSFCFSLWGGRFSLIVPCQNAAPMPEFNPWLEAFDPDLVYSYVPLSEFDQVALHESLYPSRVQFHGRPRLDDKNPHFRPSIDIAPLSANTVIPVVGGPSAFEGRNGITIVSAMGSMASDRFLGDSFGIPIPQVRNAILGRLSQFGKMLHVISTGEIEPRQRFLRDNEEVVDSTVALLQRMTSSRRIMGLSQLSASLAPHFDVEQRTWSSSYNIVIGDTVADRLLYWNARQLMAPWRDGSDVDLCIPTAKFEDDTFVAALREFISKRNSVTIDGNSSPRATIRSTTLPPTLLENLSGRLRSNRKWITYDWKLISSISE